MSKDEVVAAGRVTILDSRERQAGTTLSDPIVSEIQAVRVVDGKPQWGETGTKVRLVGIIDAADLADPTFNMDIALEWSPDGVRGWRTWVASTGWRGGQLDRQGNPKPPHCAWSGTGIQPGFFRGVAITRRTSTFALDLDII
jgi:hypothetical protein